MANPGLLGPVLMLRPGPGARLVGVAILVGSLAACASGGSGPGTSTPATGTIVLRVRLSGSCPVVQEGRDCSSTPYQATIKVQRPGGTIQTEVRSDEQGIARLELPTGRYQLLPVQPQPGVPPAAPSQTVEVRSGQTTEVDISYDSGVR